MGQVKQVMGVYNIGGVDQYTKHFFAGGAYEIEVNHLPDPDETTTKKYYHFAGQMVAMHDGTSLKYLAQDHLSSTSIVMNTSGGLLSQNRYMPFGEVRDITGGPIPETITDFGYTGQRDMGGMGLMDYRARFYSPVLGRFTQPDRIVGKSGSPQNLNRYAYVENNPIIFIDPDGFEKVIIVFGKYADNTNSFRAAARTQYKAALEAGYSEEDILMVEITTDKEFLETISGSDNGEIEKLYVMTHGWGGNDGGIQLSTGANPNFQVTKDDFGAHNKFLTRKFSNNANMYINACQVGKGGKNSLAQTLADSFDIDVHAYKQKLKFWTINNLPYSGDDYYDPRIEVIMKPYWFGELFEGLDLSIPRDVKPKKFTPTIHKDLKSDVFIPY